MVNLINVERVTVSYGTRAVLREVSLGVQDGDAIGVVGRNGDGKTTLLQTLTGERAPGSGDQGRRPGGSGDRGRVTHTAGLSVGYLRQSDDFAATDTVRSLIVGGRPDHIWAAEPATRAVVEHLLAGVNLDATAGTLSGGERRRVALVAQLLAGHDLLVLDEPTNHLDVEAIEWLAGHLTASRTRAMVVVSHDRWFLDAVTTQTWEVHDGTVDSYDGGYAAYVLARAERMRQAAGAEARRRNLMRKELAWLRRGPPARTSKPKFRIQAANALIADEPPPRDSLALQRLATTRLGKDVFDLHHVSLQVGDRVVLDGTDWSIGPGARIGLVGVNGTGKTSVLRLLAGEIEPTAGTIKRGRTLRIRHLSQSLRELSDVAGPAAPGSDVAGPAAPGSDVAGPAAPGSDVAGPAVPGSDVAGPAAPGSDRVLDAIEDRRRITQLAGGREVSAAGLVEDFGFTGDKLTTRIDDLSGGERRRLQFLRLLLDEPNVLLLDEPTNDLDIETLTVIEDYLDGWPGTLIVVTHDRYLLERVTDVTYALSGDGRCALLPGGIDQYLASRREVAKGPPVGAARTESAAARARRTQKELARLETQLGRLEERIAGLHELMAAVAHDHVRLGELTAELNEVLQRREDLEQAWLAAADE